MFISSPQSKSPAGTFLSVVSPSLSLDAPSFLDSLSATTSLLHRLNGHRLMPNLRQACFKLVSDIPCTATKSHNPSFFHSCSIALSTHQGCCSFLLPQVKHSFQSCSIQVDVLSSLNAAMVASRSWSDVNRILHPADRGDDD